MSYKNSYSEYCKKLSSAMRFMKYFTYLLLAIFFIGGMFIYRDDITVENFQYLMRYIDIQRPELSETRDEIRFTQQSDAKFCTVKDNIAVITKTSFSIYDFSGKRTFYDNGFSYQNPCFESNDKYVLVYDLYGNSISIYNSFSRLFQKTFSYNIEGVSLSSDGSFTVIASEKGYSGGVLVYNNKFKEIFKFMSRDKMITDACYNPSKKRLVCASTGVRSGSFLTNLYFFNINDEEIKNEVSLSSEIPLKLSYTDEGFVLLTSSRIIFYDFNAAVTASYDFEFNTVNSFYMFDNFMAVTLKTAITGTDMQINYYDFGGKLLYSDYRKDTVTDIASSKDKIICLSEKEVSVYNYNLKSDGEIFMTEENKFASEGKYKRVFAYGKYYILISNDGAKKIYFDQNL